ncbi:LuxR C-terminal-related transcriptional regulator [Kutzneria buriramensis]|uniref:PAS domain-containing protein n=1 Tax=Kutzneria buriramensis TaxID=1045776 RepID=A0A3E0GTL8_9PSEU|nr:LuxR C-terminal-related transcriptional regulator [Kutzneria buriramensis]REH26976.1 PAS domain-containing protein [Kutzneria buriramensis]
MSEAVSATVLRLRDDRVRAVDTDDSGLSRPLFDRSGAGVAVLNRELLVTNASAALGALFDTRPSTLVGIRFPDLFLAPVHDTMRRQLAELAVGRRLRFAERLVGMRPGERVFFADVTGRFLDPSSLIMVVDPGDTPWRVWDDGPSVLLSKVDARILEGLAAGESAVRMALRLHLSRQSVDYHVGAMLRRLSVPSRTALVAKACAAGLLDSTTWPLRVPAKHIH